MSEKASDKPEASPDEPAKRRSRVRTNPVGDNRLSEIAQQAMWSPKQLQDFREGLRAAIDTKAMEAMLQSLGDTSPELLATRARGQAILDRFWASNGGAPRIGTALEELKFLSTTGAFASLSKASDFAELDPPQGTYSPQLENAGSYFASTELVVTGVDDLHKAITTLIKKTDSLSLVWRGARDSSWGLHSHLYRQLMTTNGVADPASRPSGLQPYPDEDQLVSAEKKILQLARSTWRFDHLSAMEIFARIQHAGGPTRLIDVTKNPYIAAWFAVEQDPEVELRDARLFAMAINPVSKDGNPIPADPVVQLDDVGGRRDPFWHRLSTPAERQELDWGTGARRRIWVPPAYDPRISAQNAAFILDGVPITSKRTSAYFRNGSDSYWRRADLLASSSIYARMYSATKTPRYTARNFAPTFSFRILQKAKSEIRDYLETRFGYGRSYIYPDIAALALHLKEMDLRS